MLSATTANSDEIDDVGHDGGQSSFFQQQSLETVNGKGEGIYLGNSAQPPGERLDGIDRAAGEKQQRIQDSKNCSRHQRVIDADNEQKHHRIQSRRRQHDHQ